MRKPFLMIRRVRQPFALVLVVLGLLTAASAQSIFPQESQVKAAFLYNIAKFVTWPPDAFPDPNSPIVIGLLGDDPGSKNLEAALVWRFEGKILDGRPIRVKRWTTPEEARQSHLLFVGVAVKDRLSEVLESLGMANILTVSEVEDFTDRGGIVHIVVSGNKIRFAINHLTARNARLQISSKLLTLGTIVR